MNTCIRGQSARKEKININYTGIFASAGCLLLLISPEVSIAAAKKGMALWWDTVVPSLLPFFICTDMLLSAGVHAAAGRIFERPVSFILGVPGEAAFVFMSSILSGYPTGAKIIGEMRRNGAVSRDEAQSMLNFCSTSGPLFTVGAVGMGMLGDKHMGYIILVSHCISALLTGLLLNPYSVLNRSHKEHYIRHDVNAEEYSDVRVMQAITGAVLRSLKTIGMIGGFIVIFTIITQFIINTCKNESAVQVITCLSGILEMTVGCSSVCGIDALSKEMKAVFCSFLISFGGISVAAQTTGVLEGTDLSMREYIRAKLLHGLLSAFITIIWI
jgi:sporulation integral membrane protein YlbJ